MTEIYGATLPQTCRVAMAAILHQGKEKSRNGRSSRGTCPEVPRSSGLPWDETRYLAVGHVTSFRCCRPMRPLLCKVLTLVHRGRMVLHTLLHSSKLAPLAHQMWAFVVTQGSRTLPASRSSRPAPQAFAWVPSTAPSQWVRTLQKRPLCLIRQSSPFSAKGDVGWGRVRVSSVDFPRRAVCPVVLSRWVWKFKGQGV